MVCETEDRDRRGRRHLVVRRADREGRSDEQVQAAAEQQLATWGFVVVAFTGDQTASGVAMLAGAQWVVAANADPSSPFFGHVNTARVGALGHSQGAGGAINATTMSGGLQDARIVVGAGADQPILPAHAGDHPVVTWGNGTFPSLTVVVVIGHGPGAA